MKTVDTFNFAGRKALVRVDFNVPLDENFQITDDTRLKAVLPTIKKILNDGGSAILMSHLGRPKAGPEEKSSLKHLISYLKEAYKTEIKFASDCIGEDAVKLAAQLQPKEILLLENLRFYKEEEKGDLAFSEKLSKLGDVYVNDAFGTAHRAHASTAVIAQFFKDKVCGYVMQAEIENAQKVLDKADKPYTAIMGGSKVSDKILIIETLLGKVDNLIIAGGMAYTFFKALGGTVGTSLLQEDQIPTALKVIEIAKQKGVNLILPVDNIIAKEFSNDSERKVNSGIQIPDGWMGLDIGPESIKIFSEVIEKSKTVLWNGPTGVFEFPNFAKGTFSVAEAVVRATKAGAFSLIGGGDSASAINNLGFGNDVSYVSTGGGALLEYMEGKALPGVAALEA
ncbi:MAG: phosphoglycerate kinase [Cytophagales bacterium]|nr:MAG: phosphoglycerate kinase [Cytophagales bacterium]